MSLFNSKNFLFIAIVIILICEVPSVQEFPDSYLEEGDGYRDQIVTRLHSVLWMCPASSAHAVE